MNFDLIRTADIRKKRVRVKKPSKAKIQVLEHLKNNNDFYHSVNSIADELGYCYLTVYKRLQELVDEEKVEKISTEKSNKHYYAYIGENNA